MQTIFYTSTDFIKYVIPFPRNWAIMGFLADNRLDLQHNNISLIFKRDPFSRILFDNDNWTW